MPLLAFPQLLSHGEAAGDGGRVALAPEVRGGEAHREQDEGQKQTGAPRLNAKRRVGLGLIDLGDEQPGRAGDDPGAADHRLTPIVDAFSCAQFTARGHGGGEVGARDGEAQSKAAVGAMTQIVQIDDLVALPSRERRLGGP